MPPSSVASSPQNLFLCLPRSTWLAEFNTSSSAHSAQGSYSREILERTVGFTHISQQRPRRVDIVPCSANDCSLSLSHFFSSQSPLIHTIFFSPLKSLLVFLWQTFLSSGSFLFSPLFEENANFAHSFFCIAVKGPFSFWSKTIGASISSQWSFSQTNSASSKTNVNIGCSVSASQVRRGGGQHSEVLLPISRVTPVYWQCRGA